MKGYEYFMRMNKEDNAVARQEFEEAIALDPEYGALYTMLAWTHLMDLPFQSSESPLISLAQASKNIKKALALVDDDYLAHLALAQLYLIRKEHDKAVSAAERAIGLNPNGAAAYGQLGFVLTFSGRAEEGIKLIGKAMRLNPIPEAYLLSHLGVAYSSLGQYEKSIEVHREVLKRTPNYLFAHIYLTASYSALGREKEARQQAEELLRLDPAFSLDEYAEMNFIKDEAELERHIDDLRRAGLK